MRGILVLMVLVVPSDAFSRPFPTKQKRGETGLNADTDTTPMIIIDETALEPLWAVERIERLSDWTDDLGEYINPLVKLNVPAEWFVGENEAVAARVEVNAESNVSSRQSTGSPTAAAAFTLAGARESVVFNPAEARAAIVTCGGLCPGLNTVIRELVMCLKRQYGAKQVYGIIGGYRGFQDPQKWRNLDEAVVKDIHNIGGTILGSSRGGFDVEVIVDALQEMKIDMLFILGGDGTVRGAMKVADVLKERKIPTAVAVVPKTIDNDIPVVDRTFGFETAVEAARHAIDAAHVEAEGFPMGLGVVKLMGRRSGFISMHATLGTRVVDLCLVPEVPFELDGPDGIVDFLFERMMANNKAVVVVAEGAGQDLIEAARQEHKEALTDLSGNALLDDIGPWLCQVLKERLDKKLAGVSLDKIALKYVDPSYMLRGIAANAADNVYCTHLAHHAVHGAFAGLSSFLVGPVNTRPCYVPLRLVADKRNVIDAAHRSVWASVVFDTGQPAVAVDEESCDVSDLDITTASGGCIAAF